MPGCAAFLGYAGQAQEIAGCPCFDAAGQVCAAQPYCQACAAGSKPGGT